jgi:Fe2+ or Zn2+ uptake regulation protein
MDQQDGSKGNAAAMATGVTDEVCHRLRTRGMRMTGGRRRLVALFASLGRCGTPQELYEEAVRAGQRPGLATVYRLIEALLDVGLCKPIVQQGRTLRYVFCPPYHHHHMICSDCGRVTNLDECHVAAPPDADFLVQAHAVDFFGRCGTCARGAGESP